MAFNQIKFIVQRDGVAYECLGGELADKLQEGDLMVVNRPRLGQTFKWVLQEEQGDENA